jgi:hypothetical protein
MPNDTAWPFDQARNVAAVTTRQIMEGEHPILLVQHLSEDHSWAFLDGQPFDMENAMLVGMGEVVMTDSTLLTIADLPPGWEATRSAVGQSWIRAQAHEI